MHFTVITDHSALKALCDKSNLTGRLQRRANKLMEHDFTIVYRPGKQNVVPDFLSCIYLNEQAQPPSFSNIDIEHRNIEEEIALKKNKIFIPLENRMRLIERAHRT